MNKIINTIHLFHKLLKKSTNLKLRNLMIKIIKIKKMKKMKKIMKNNNL